MAHLTKKMLLTATFFTVFVPQLPATAEVTGEIAYGYDSSPLRLRGSLHEEEAGFLEANLGLNHQFDSGFGVDLRAVVLSYEDDADDADRFVYSGALGYKKKTDFMGRKATFDARVRYVDLDRTYVSRTTGTIPLSLGVPTPDRYDTKTFDVRARAKFEIADDVDLKFTVDWRNREYVDYTALDLSNLDHSHWAAGMELEFSPVENHTLSGGVTYRLRDYDSREGRDLLGDPLVGSVLEYEFIEFEAGWKYKISATQNLTTAYTYEVREDNLSGYYNTTTHEASVRYRHKVRESDRLDLQAKYLDYSYDNSASDTLLENEEPISSRKGFKVSADYDYFLFSSGPANLWATAGVSYEDYDSVEDAYIYDRTIAQIGLKAEF